MKVCDCFVRRFWNKWGSKTYKFYFASTCAEASELRYQGIGQSFPLFLSFPCRLIPPRGWVLFLPLSQMLEVAHGTRTWADWRMSNTLIAGCRHVSDLHNSKWRLPRLQSRWRLHHISCWGWYCCPLGPRNWGKGVFSCYLKNCRSSSEGPGDGHIGRRVCI